MGPEHQNIQCEAVALLNVHEDIAVPCTKHACNSQASYSMYVQASTIVLARCAHTLYIISIVLGHMCTCLMFTHMYTCMYMQIHASTAC